MCMCPYVLMEELSEIYDVWSETADAQQNSQAIQYPKLRFTMSSTKTTVKWQSDSNLAMSLMSSLQGKTIHRLGEDSPSQAVEHSSQRIQGKSEF